MPKADQLDEVLMCKIFFQTIFNNYIEEETCSQFHVPVGEAIPMNDTEELNDVDLRLSCRFLWWPIPS
jgi:hypothetical protein